MCWGGWRWLWDGGTARPQGVTFEHPHEVRVQPFETPWKKHSRQKEQQVQRLCDWSPCRQGEDQWQRGQCSWSRKELDLVGHSQDFILCSGGAGHYRRVTCVLLAVVRRVSYRGWTVWNEGDQLGGCCRSPGDWMITEPVAFQTYFIPKHALVS